MLILFFVSACGSGAGPSDAGGDGADAPADTFVADAAEAPALETTDAGASTDGGATLCGTAGWCELTGTKLADACPDPATFPGVQGTAGCAALVDDGSSGVADQTRGRLVLWGGGRPAYGGNEVYALDLAALALRRLDDPSDSSGGDAAGCGDDATPDGRPLSRRTFDGLSYVAHADRLFAFGGGLTDACLGKDTWTLDLADVSSAGTAAPPWMLMNPTGGAPIAAGGAVSDYDPNGNRVILGDTSSLWSYDFDQNRYTLLTPDAGLDPHLTARVDPKRNLFVAVGNAGTGQPDAGVVVFSLGGNHARQTWTSRVQGCDGLINAVSPGLAYDPVQDKLVGWAGGDDVYLFDLDARSCRVVHYPGGPGPQRAEGTRGRFRYFDTLRVFAVVNAADENAYTLRLTR